MNQYLRPHNQMPPPKAPFLFQTFQPTALQPPPHTILQNPPQQATMPPSTHPTLPPPPSSRKPPSERAQAKTPLRADCRQQKKTKQELTQLQDQRCSVLDSLRGHTARHKRLIQSLEHIETENEQWQTPNTNLGEVYRLRDKIEQVEKLVKECHRRWDEVGEEIEEKHVEIAFGGSGED